MKWAAPKIKRRRLLGYKFDPAEHMGCVCLRDACVHYGISRINPRCKEFEVVF